MGSSRDHWEESESYEREMERRREQKEDYARRMAADGYVEVPVPFREYLGNRQWIHAETLRHLRAWLIDDTLYKLVKE